MFNDPEKICEKYTTENNAVSRVLDAGYGRIYLLYIKQLSDMEALRQDIMRPILQYWHYIRKPLNADELYTQVLCVEECRFFEKTDDLDTLLFSGMTLLFTQDGTCLVINLRINASSSPSAPELNYSVWGAKDSFVENIEINLSLLRYRIKDPRLRTKTILVGRRTKTAVLVSYIADIANNDYVRLVEQRLNAIDIDGILEAAHLQWFLKDKKFSLFPQAGLEQRVDVACGALLEGKVVLLCEGSPLAILTPKLLAEFFRADEDESENVYFSVFSKLLRYLCALISITATPLYIALVAFHAEALPTAYTMVLASGRAGVPMTVVTEIILMEILVEILRECLMRIPKNIGSAIGIVGGIVVGQATVEAGIVSPLVLVIVALSLVTSFVVPDYALTATVRIVKFLLIFATAFFGLFGLMAGLFLLCLTLTGDTSLHTPYFAPFSPFLPRDALKSIFTNKYVSVRRPSFLHPKNKIRQKK